MMKMDSRTSHEVKGMERFDLISKDPDSYPRLSRKCTHYKKSDNTINCCWDLHPERKVSKNRSVSDQRSMTTGATSSNNASVSENKKKKVADQIKSLQAYHKTLKEGDNKSVSEVNQALAVQSGQGNPSVCNMDYEQWSYSSYDR